MAMSPSKHGGVFTIRRGLLAVPRCKSIFFLYNFCVVLLRAYVDACVYPHVVFIPVDDSIRRFNLLVAHIVPQCWCVRILAFVVILLLV